MRPHDCDETKAIAGQGGGDVAGAHAPAAPAPLPLVRALPPPATRPVVARGCELGIFLPAKVGNLDCTLCFDRSAWGRANRYRQVAAPAHESGPPARE